MTWLFPTYINNIIELQHFPYYLVKLKKYNMFTMKYIIYTYYFIVSILYLFTVLCKIWRRLDQGITLSRTNFLLFSDIKANISKILSYRMPMSYKNTHPSSFRSIRIAVYRNESSESFRTKHYIRIKLKLIRKIAIFRKTFKVQKLFRIS